MTTIKIFEEKKEQEGFTFLEGFAALLDEEGNILAATSGWSHEDKLYVYRPTPEGEWVGDWEDESTFPVKEVDILQFDYWRQEEIASGLRYLKNRKPHISEETIRFTKKVAGEKSRTGGEYGEWVTYSPIPEFPGLYEVKSHTTCELVDSPVYEGIYGMTEKDYRKMRRESERIEREGFKLK